MSLTSGPQRAVECVSLGLESAVAGGDIAAARRWRGAAAYWFGIESSFLGDEGRKENCTRPVRSCASSVGWVLLKVGLALRLVVFYLLLLPQVHQVHVPISYAASLRSTP